MAVHGLGGDAFTTWTHPKSKAFLLKDFLPHQIPDARIMTFSYDADAAFGQSTAEIVDHAKSLLASLVDKREESEVRHIVKDKVKYILMAYQEIYRPLVFIAYSLGGIVVKLVWLCTRSPKSSISAEMSFRLCFRHDWIHDTSRSRMRLCFHPC